jgi:hypothetical protein
MASLVPGGRGGLASVWRVLVGPPLRARDVSREQITPVEGLPALSLDALTSVAYGLEAIIVVLAVAGAGALHLVLPVTIAIVTLLASLLAAALVVEYTLTVAVSIAAGVAALTSAFPGLGSATVPICLGILAAVTMLNLRALGAAARACLLPTLVFIVGLLAVIAIGLNHPLALHARSPAARARRNRRPDGRSVPARPARDLRSAVHQ